MKDAIRIWIRICGYVTCAKKRREGKRGGMSDERRGAVRLLYMGLNEWVEVCECAGCLPFCCRLRRGWLLVTGDVIVIVILGEAATPTVLRVKACHLTIEGGGSECVRVRDGECCNRTVHRVLDWAGRR